MNIRQQFAYEVAEEIGCKVLKLKCNRCHSPLLENSEQRLPFCWECTTSRRTAQEGQTLLLRCKFKFYGVEITHESSWRCVA